MSQNILNPRLAYVLELLIERAKKGEPAPTSVDLGLELRKKGFQGTTVQGEKTAYVELALRGLIRYEIYGRRRTRMIIAQGPHSGLSTKAPPEEWKPFQAWGPETGGSRQVHVSP